jgi:hypothetical protein
VGASSWITIAGLVWLTNHILVEPGQPLFTVPTQILVGSFVLPWPLWMVRYRPGITMARGLTHAGALAWHLASHLPFVSGNS